MGLLRNLKIRLDPRNVNLELEEETVALMLQMGWAEKFMGVYIFTERGEVEFVETIRRETNNATS